MGEEADVEMRRSGRIQPTWGRTLGVLIAVLLGLAVVWGVVEVIVLAAVVSLLVASYLVRRHVRRAMLQGSHLPEPTVPAERTLKMSRSGGRVGFRGPETDVARHADPELLPAGNRGASTDAGT
jgi:hypothetical protein